LRDEGARRPARRQGTAESRDEDNGKEPERRPRRPPARRDFDKDEDEDDEDEEPRRRRGPKKPGQVQAIAIMTLVSGILATVWGTLFVLSCYGLLWPGTYYSLFAGIFAIVEGSKLLSEQGYLRPPPRLVSILLIVNIINLNVPCCAMGIINLVFLNEPEVRRYFRG